MRKRSLLGPTLVIIGITWGAFSIVMARSCNWQTSANEHLDAARSAESVWETRYELKQADEILANHGRNLNIEGYIENCIYISELESAAAYQEEMYNLKNSLDELRVTDDSTMWLVIMFIAVPFLVCGIMDVLKEDC